MRILIIGGTRFLGPYVIRRLLEQHHEITMFNRGETMSGMTPRVNHIRGDRENILSFSGDFERISPDVVIDMIAYTESGASNVTKALRNIAQRLIVLSSMDVYLAYDIFRGVIEAPPCPTPFDEESPLRTNLYPYRAKAESEDDLLYNYEKIDVERICANASGLMTTILRLPVVYGPGDYQHRLFEYIKRMQDGRPYILLDESRAKWRWTRGYAENVAAAIALAAIDERAVRRTYNVGERDAYSELEWVIAIAKAFSWRGEIAIIPKGELPGHVSPRFNWEQDIYGDTSLIRNELGYVEPVSRAEAVKRTVNWAMSHPPEDLDPGQFDYAAEDSIFPRHVARWMV